MNTLTEKRFEGKFSTELAIASFGIGTLIFASHLILPKVEEIYYCGFIYVLLAAFANSIVLLSLLYHFIVLPHQREYIAVKMLIVLANIPIAAFYVYLVFDLF